MPDLRVQIKSIYDRPEDSDGLRVYIERRKPSRRRWQGLKVDRHEISLSPSARLRRQLTHDPQLWKIFRDEFEKELRSESAERVLAELRRTASSQAITLLYDGLDSAHNAARVVEEMIEKRHHHRPVK